MGLTRVIPTEEVSSFFRFRVLRIPVAIEVRPIRIGVEPSDRL